VEPPTIPVIEAPEEEKQKVQVAVPETDPVIAEEVQTQAPVAQVAPLPVKKIIKKKPV
jgi:hypothetical protein